MSFSKDEMLEALKAFTLDLIVKTYDFLKNVGKEEEYAELLGRELAVRVQRAFGKDKKHAITYLNLILTSLELPQFHQEGKKYMFECNSDECSLMRTSIVTKTDFSHVFCEKFLGRFLKESGFSTKIQLPLEGRNGRIEAK